MLHARLLGALEVRLNGTAIESAASQRPWALFSYLALTERPVARSELADRFWPDVLDQSARASLRSALWALRRALGDAVVVEGDRVRLCEDEELWIDIREFERLAGSDPEAALALCRGELLEGLEDDWARSARERHRARVIELLDGLARAALHRGDVRPAIELTRRQTELDPFDEESHRRLIERMTAAGDRAGALLVFRALSERLRRELGVAPSGATRELVERLRGEPAPASDGAAVPSGLLPLVGREPELRELEQAWKGVEAALGAAALIRGEAGIGKTRLATELCLRARAGGALTASCAALDLGGSAPLSLWAELIRELLPSLPAPPAEVGWPDDLAALVAELPAHFARAPVPESAVAPDLQRTRLFEAAVALLSWAAQRAPLLLVFDDIHSADAPSLELAGYAARRISGLRVMMVMTRRELPHSVSADRLEHALRARGVLTSELDLSPLSSAPGAALARKAARLSEPDVKRVVARAEGNPLLVVETARALARGQDEPAPSLRGSVRAVLGPLSGATRKLVEVCAVAARAIESRESGVLELEDAAEEALQTGLLASTGGAIGFRHALLREAVYEEIAEPRRRTLHHSWAQALLSAEQDGAVGRPAEVARHLRLAGDDLHAVPELVRAAAKARSVAALDQAVAYLEEALEIAPERADIWLELGAVEAWRARREPSDAAFARALELLDGVDALERARAYLLRARANNGPICVPRVVLESAGAALELIDESGQAAYEERSEAVASLAWAEAVAGSIDRAEQLLAELSGLPSANDLLRTYDAGHARALALMARGRFVESYGPSIAAGEAIAKAGRPDLAYGCWANVAAAANLVGEHERALEFLGRGMAAVAGHGLQSLEIHLLAGRSFILTGLGRLEDARRAAESERVLAEQLGQADLTAMAAHDLGLIALEAGEFSEAVALLKESLQPGAPISAPLTRLALAEALARAGEPERAAEEMRATVLEPVRPSDFPDALVPRLTRVQGLVALARGERDEALRRLEEAVEGWERVLARSARSDNVTTVLADLGRPVVGLVDPGRELRRARADLDAVKSQGGVDAVVS